MWSNKVKLPKIGSNGIVPVTGPNKMLDLTFIFSLIIPAIDRGNFYFLNLFYRSLFTVQPEAAGFMGIGPMLLSTCKSP
jgi:hypothetical protein